MHFGIGLSKSRGSWLVPFILHDEHQKDHAATLVTVSLYVALYKYVPLANCTFEISAQRLLPIAGRILQVSL